MTNYQKDFWSNISKTIEHNELLMYNELLTYIIKHSKNKQRLAIITLLDLRNAFGEVDHRLILKTLKYHHIPKNMKSLIRTYYDNSVITMGTGNFSTKWSQCAELEVCTHKCVTLGIKKMETKSVQFKKYLHGNNDQIPALKDNKSFEYLGKMFLFSMKTDSIQNELKN